MYSIEIWRGGEKRAEARGENEAALLYRGAYEASGGLAVYPPKAFAGDMHLISIKPDASGEYRNLAENPADQRGEVEAYPHATANVETRNESGFAALIPAAPRKADRRKRAPYFTSAVSLTTK